jgi:hypothetical protein
VYFLFILQLKLKKAFSESEICGLAHAVVEEKRRRFLDHLYEWVKNF